MQSTPTSTIIIYIRQKPKSQQQMGLLMCILASAALGALHHVTSTTCPHLWFNAFRWGLLVITSKKKQQIESKTNILAHSCLTFQRLQWIGAFCVSSRFPHVYKCTIVVLQSPYLPIIYILRVRFQSQQQTPSNQGIIRQRVILASYIFYP